MKQPARSGHPTQPANEGVRKDHVPIKVNVNSSPSTFSHQGPCCAADINEATPNESTTTRGHTICSGSPRPEPKTIKVLRPRITPEKITIRPAIAKTA
jgi:hypothetical protein